jgi:hypothetical protein
MSRAKLRLLGVLGIVFAVLSVPLSAQAQAIGPAAQSIPPGEASVIYIEFRFLSAQVLPGSFNASARKVWRSGTRYMRLEEEPDEQQGIAGTMIVNEPNVWMWNRLTGIARHIVDHGPTYVAHFPLFPDERALEGLEFGQEEVFFRKSGAKRRADEVVDHVECSVQSLIVGDATLTLYIRKSTRLPYQVSITKPRNAYSVRYESYEPALPFDATLFAPPRNVRIEEAK